MDLSITPTQAQLDFAQWFASHLDDGKLSPSKVRKALKDINADFLDAQGRSPIERLCSRSAREFDYLEGEIFTLLMEKGANPLGLGVPVAKTMGHATRAGMLIHRTIDFEREHPERPLRTSEGENILHLVATHRPRDLHGVLERNNPKSLDVTMAMLDGKRFMDLSTPAHVIWRTILFEGPEHIARVGKQTDVYENENIAALVGTQALLDAGADLTVVDLNGQSASQLAVECVETGLVKVPTGWRRTVNQLRKIAETTPVAAHTHQGSKPPRL